MGGKQIELSVKKVLGHFMIAFGVLAAWVAVCSKSGYATDPALCSLVLIGCGVYLSRDRPPAKGKPGPRLWRVTGIDTHTGQRISREIEAESRATAVSLATLDGVDVESADRSDARTESHPGHTGSE